METPLAGFRIKRGRWKHPQRHSLRDVNGRQVVGKLFPKARITSGYRGPHHHLSKKNPNSFHASRHGAIDIAPIPGMTFEQAAQQIVGSGYELLEAIDEVKYPSSHATGPHWHFVIGKR